MKAMILAAGRGLRLRPLTDGVPKALVEVGGVPILEVVAARLKAAGVDSFVVNLHHKGEMVEDFVRAKSGFGMRFAFSREDELLETGGGLKKAAAFFDDGRPFFVHNVDVVSGVDLAALHRSHQEAGALATLSVRRRDSSRQLLFDPTGRLCGRQAAGQAPAWVAGPVGGAEPLAFDGIHVLSPGIFARMTEAGAFPITGTYLRLAGEGERIGAFRAEPSYWGEIGSLEKLEAVRRRAAGQGLPGLTGYGEGLGNREGLG
ncbi:MAG: NTP transferase domain-containing protein [Elusimicrobia bacterium]|nr:NTP transferase domain-containing protein [Elusimicrobiota bacterium]